MSELLLIDDDVELCELLTTWLTQEGFSIRAAHDGAQAGGEFARIAGLGQVVVGAQFQA
ncbi:hypothetical protein ACCC94_18025, partial [Pseudomonas sp. Pseusp97]